MLSTSDPSVQPCASFLSMGWIYCYELLNTIHLYEHGFCICMCLSVLSHKYDCQGFKIRPILNNSFQYSMLYVILLHWMDVLCEIKGTWGKNVHFMIECSREKNSRIHFLPFLSKDCFSCDAGVGSSPDASFLNRIKCNFPSHIFLISKLY